MNSIKSYLRSIKHGNFSRAVRGLPSRIKVSIFLRLGKKFTIDISGRMGFGALILHAMYLTEHFNNRGVEIKIISTNPLYAETEDGDLFETHTPLLSSSRTIGPMVNYRFSQDISMDLLNKSADFSAAKTLIRQVLRLEGVHQVEAGAIIASIGVPYIAVHFRGSDKSLEASEATPEAVIDAIEDEMSRTGLDHIFVATDEPSFLKLVASRFPKVTHVEGQVLATGTRPPHFSGETPSRLAREAVVTMLVLSQASTMVRTCSNLSLVSALYSSSLSNVITLNHSSSDLSGALENYLYSSTLTQH